MRSSLVKSGSGAKSAVIDAEETLQYHQTQLAPAERPARRGRRQSRRAGAREGQGLFQFHRRQRAKAGGGAEAGRRLARAAGQGQAEIRAHEPRQPDRRRGLWPIGHDHRSGGRRAARSCMRIVPEGAALEIECYLANKRRRLRQAGPEGGGEDRDPSPSPATARWRRRSSGSPATPFREPDADQAEGRFRAGAQREKTFAGAQRTQNLVFPVTLAPAAHDDGRRRPDHSADARHGGERRNRHRQPPHPRIYLLAAGRNRVAGPEGAVSDNISGNEKHLFKSNGAGGRT